MGSGSVLDRPLKKAQGLQRMKYESGKRKPQIDELISSFMFQLSSFN